MGKTWNEINEILGESGFATSTLDEHLRGADGTTSDREAIAATLRLVTGLVKAVELLAIEVDALRVAATGKIA